MVDKTWWGWFMDSSWFTQNILRAAVKVVKPIRRYTLCIDTSGKG